MAKFYLLAAISLLLLSGCYNLGTVGYMVPAENDDGAKGELIIERKFNSYSYSGMYNDLNETLVDEKKNKLTNVIIYQENKGIPVELNTKVYKIN